MGAPDSNNHAATMETVIDVNPASQQRNSTYGITGITRSASLIELSLRFCVVTLTLISLCVIASDQGFQVVAPMNYLLASTILPFLYSVAQCVISLYYMTTGNSLLPIGFYTIFSIVADLVSAILLLSGSSAALGATTSWNHVDNFIVQADGAASMALLAFFLMLPLIFISIGRGK